MQAERQAAREAALKDHIETMPPNLLRAYLVEYIDGGSSAIVEALVVALHAQSKMPAIEVPG